MMEKRFQKALEEALLSDPEELLARRPNPAFMELPEGWICDAARADPEAITLVPDLVPEPGYRARFPAHLLRWMALAQELEAAQCQGNPAG